MLDLFTVLVFLFVLASVYAVRAFSGRRRREERTQARLADLLSQVEGEAEHVAPVKYPDESVMIGDENYQGRFPGLHRTYRRIEKGIEMLGWKDQIVIRAGSVLLVSLVLAGFIGKRTDYFLTTTVVGTVLLFIALSAFCYWKTFGQYLEALGAALPEAIDSIARICRAGVPIQTACGLAVQSLRGPLAQELLAIDRWLKLGVPLKQVLQESARRVPLPEYRFFAVILIISQESGGRLADTLERLAATLRDRAELELKVQAKTSEARASIKIVACLVPGVLAYMYVQAPGDFEFLVTDPTGLKVLGYAAVSVALGLLVTWLMVRRIQ